MTLSLTRSYTLDLTAELVQALRALRDAEGSAEEKKTFAIGHLRTTDSVAIRNAAAIALSDLKASDSIPVIADVIMTPGVADSAGTLLYALEEMEADLPLATFVHVLVNDSYEARHQALDLLHGNRVLENDPRTIESRLASLERLLSSPDEGKAADVREALEILRSEPEPSPS